MAMDIAESRLPEAARHECPQCKSAVDDADQFCRTCGLDLRPGTAAVDAFLARAIPERIDAALKDRFRDQKVVEIETAELLAERAGKWLKLLGVFIGIPILLITAFLSFMGLKTWSNIQNVTKQAFDLQSELTGPRQQLSQITEEIGKLQTDLQTQKTTFERRQDNLEQQLKGIRSRLGFCPAGENMPADFKEKTEDMLSQFIKWLQDRGFNNLDTHISICVYSRNTVMTQNIPIPRNSHNSLYINNTLYIHRDKTAASTLVLREFTHYVLVQAISADYTDTEIESAMSDYLPTSFQNSPVIAENTTYQRTLDNSLTYPEAKKDLFHRGQVWAGALWDCRQKGQKQVDELTLHAWQAVGKSEASKAAKEFAAALVAAPEPAGPCFAQEIARRELPR
jgi:hypothetical protein